MQTGAATLENSVEIPQEIKNRASLWPCDCTTGYLPQRYRCSEKNGHLYPNVYSSNGHGRQTVERTKMPFNGWMDKEDVVHKTQLLKCSWDLGGLGGSVRPLILVGVMISGLWDWAPHWSLRCVCGTCLGSPLSPWPSLPKKSAHVITLGLPWCLPFD